MHIWEEVPTANVPKLPWILELVPSTFLRTLSCCHWSEYIASLHLHGDESSSWHSPTTLWFLLVFSFSSLPQISFIIWFINSCTLFLCKGEGTLAAREDFNGVFFYMCLFILVWNTCQILVQELIILFCEVVGSFLE